jgi:hypothetical protein
VLDLFFIFVLAAHLLAMNIATAAPLVCIWLKRRELRHGDEAAGPLGRFLAWQSINGLLLGMALGLLAAWLLWLKGDERFFSALAIVPRRRLWFGVIELVFFLVLMFWYAWAWPRVHRPRLWHPALAILAATDLIYHFPPLFAAITVLQGRPLPAEELTYSSFLALMYAPETMARVSHFLLASLAVTGALVMGYSLRQADAAIAGRLAAWGARLALAASAAQFLAGTWLLLSLPRRQQQLLAGQDSLATGLLAASGVAIIVLLHALASVAQGEASRRQIVRSLLLMGLVVISMTAARHVSQLAASGLAPHH